MTAVGCPAGQVGTLPVCYPLPPAPAANGKTWKVSFAEGFGGTTLNTKRLSPCFDWASALSTCSDSFNQGRERYLPSQVQVSNGTAKLVAEPLRPPVRSAGCLNGQCTYKSGLLSTTRMPGNPKYNFTFTYGYVESRMKFPATQGFFTAFWMLPADPSYNYRSEIDIAEILGHDPASIYMNYHYSDRAKTYTPNNGSGNNGACAARDYSQEFVKLGVDWQPDHVAWYINGVKCGQYNGDARTIENGPMQVIIDLMVDHQWQRDWGKPLLDTNLKRQLEVDYIRVYQQH